MTEDDAAAHRPMRVVKVLNPSKIVLNQGSRDGIKKGQRFLIYSLGEELFDPVSRESLGRLEIVRGRGEVHYVQERMSQVESLETKTNKSRNRSAANGLSMLSQLGALNTIEEIVDAPFDHVEEGDICRPI